MSIIEENTEVYALLSSLSFLNSLTNEQVNKVVSLYDRLKGDGRITKQNKDSKDNLLYLYALFFEKYLLLQKIDDITWYLPDSWAVKYRLKAVYLSYYVNNIITDYGYNFSKAITFIKESLKEDFAMKLEINKTLGLSIYTYFLVKGAKELDSRGLIPLRKKIFQDAIFDSGMIEFFTPEILCGIVAKVPEMAIDMNIDNLTDIYKFLLNSSKDFEFLNMKFPLRVI